MVVHLSFSHAKQLLMKLLSESLQTYANLLLVLMPTNYTPTRCVNPCPEVFIRVGISIHKPADSHFDKTRPVALKIWSCLIFNVQDLIQSFYTTGRQKKIDCFRVNGFCPHCNTVFEAMGCFYHFCTCQELHRSLTEEDIKRGSRKRELVELRRGYIQGKCFIVNETLECEWWRLYRTTANVKLHIPEKVPLMTISYRTPTPRRNKERKSIWLRSMRHWCTQKFESKLCYFSSDFQEHFS